MSLNSSLFPKKGICVVLGAQWGDEGKGKLVDALAEEADIVARCQGGNNAGHTIVVESTHYDFHMVPSGLIHPHCVSVIGNGVVVHLPSLFKELETLKQKGIDWENRVVVSDRAHVVLDVHQVVDGLREQERGGANIGTTRKGIGPAYSSKSSRSGFRIHQLFEYETFKTHYHTFIENRKKRYGDFEYDTEKELMTLHSLLPKLKPMVKDTVHYFHEALHQNKKKILVEGANAAMLDIDFGTYPYVTSSSATIGGVCTGLGVPSSAITEVVGVVKAYTTRVGAGPFPTELTNELGSQLQTLGREIGVTTGRKRRCGWLDLMVVQYAHWINGFTQLNVTKLDVLSSFHELQLGVAYEYQGERMPSFPADLNVVQQCKVIYETFPGWQSDISKVTSWDALPVQAQRYIRRIEQVVNVPVTTVGVGPGRDALIRVPPLSTSKDPVC